MAKTIIITGAGRGVGKSCAERFLKEGWSVGLIGRNPDPLSEMEKEHENAMALPCDVADADAVDASFNAFVERFGRLDALFNNAGITLPGKPIDEVDVDDWRSLIDINLTGSFICARKAFGLMRHQDRKAAALSITDLCLPMCRVWALWPTRLKTCDHGVNPHDFIRWPRLQYRMWSN